MRETRKKKQMKPYHLMINKKYYQNKKLEETYLFSITTTTAGIYDENHDDVILGVQRRIKIKYKNED